jgi:hypothetical protein
MKEATTEVEDDSDILPPAGGSCLLVEHAKEEVKIDKPTDRSVDECWFLYRSSVKSHTGLTPTELYAMMQSLIDAADCVAIIDDSYYKLVIDSLNSRYYDLELIVRARGLTEFPLLPLSSEVS